MDGGQLRQEDQLMSLARRQIKFGSSKLVSRSKYENNHMNINYELGNQA